MNLRWAFLLVRISVWACWASPRQRRAWLSPQWLLSPSIPAQAVSVLCSAPVPKQRGNVPSVYLATSFVQRAWNWLPQLC
jgi:hypothetical protein